MNFSKYPCLENDLEIGMGSNTGRFVLYSYHMPKQTKLDPHAPMDVWRASEELYT